MAKLPEIERMYEAKALEVQGLLRRFEAKLAEHAERFEKDPRNWGFVGDLGGWAELLRRMLGEEEGLDEFHCGAGQQGQPRPRPRS